MIKHIEVKTYTYGDIGVTVVINFDKQHISLVQKDQEGRFGESDTRFNNKEYKFVKRGLEYMNGWRNILHAIEYAIDQAEKELKDYLDMKQKEKDDETTEILMQATKLVKNKKK